MSRLSDFIKENKEICYDLAKKNTPTNQSGRAVITIDDEWRDEPEWDAIFKETQGVNQ